jgi:hypothetical protein
VKRLSRAVLLALALLPIGCAATSDTSRIADAQGETVQRPEWEVGDRWTFRWKAGTDGGEYTNRIVAANDGGYTIASGSVRRYLTADFELISAMRNGVVTEQHSPPRPSLKFPLRANMKWTQGERLAASGST